MLKMLNTEEVEEEGEKSEPWLTAFWRGKGNVIESLVSLVIYIHFCRYSEFNILEYHSIALCIPECCTMGTEGC